jgi:hypothetical protein
MTLVNYRVIIRTFGFIELDKLKLIIKQEDDQQINEEGKLGRIYNYYASRCSIKSTLKHYFNILIKKCDMHIEIHDDFYDSFVINYGNNDNYNIISNIKQKIKSLDMYALNEDVDIKDILLVLSPTDNMRPYILKCHECEKYFILTKNLNFYQIRAFIKTHGIRISRKAKAYINDKKIIDYNSIPTNIFFGTSMINILKIASNKKNDNNNKKNIVVTGKIIIEKQNNSDI